MEETETQEEVITNPRQSFFKPGWIYDAKKSEIINEVTLPYRNAPIVWQYHGLSHNRINSFVNEFEQIENNDGFFFILTGSYAAILNPLNKPISKGTVTLVTYERKIYVMIYSTDKRVFKVCDEYMRNFVCGRVTELRKDVGEANIRCYFDAGLDPPDAGCGDFNCIKKCINEVAKYVSFSYFYKNWRLKSISVAKTNIVMKPEITELVMTHCPNVVHWLNSNDQIASNVRPATIDLSNEPNYNAENISRTLNHSVTFDNKNINSSNVENITKNLTEQQQLRLHSKLVHINVGEETEQKLKKQKSDSKNNESGISETVEKGLPKYDSATLPTYKPNSVVRNMPEVQSPIAEFVDNKNFPANVSNITILPTEQQPQKKFSLQSKLCNMNVVKTSEQKLIQHESHRNIEPGIKENIKTGVPKKVSSNLFNYLPNSTIVTIPVQQNCYVEFTDRKIYPSDVTNLTILPIEQQKLRVRGKFCNVNILKKSKKLKKKNSDKRNIELILSENVKISIAKNELSNLPKYLLNSYGGNKPVMQNYFVQLAVRCIYPSNFTNITILSPEQQQKKFSQQSKLCNMNVIKKSKTLRKKKFDSKIIEPGILENDKKGLPKDDTPNIPGYPINSNVGNIRVMQNHSVEFADRNIYPANVTNITILPQEQQQQKFSVQSKLCNVNVVQRSKKLFKRKSDSKNIKPGISENLMTGVPKNVSSHINNYLPNSEIGNIADLQNGSMKFTDRTIYPSNVTTNITILPPEQPKLSLQSKLCNVNILNKSKKLKEKNLDGRPIELANSENVKKDFAENDSPNLRNCLLNSDVVNMPVLKNSLEELVDKNICPSNITHITILPPKQQQQMFDDRGKLSHVDVAKRSKKLWKKKSDSRCTKPGISENQVTGVPKNYLPNSKIGNVPVLKNCSLEFTHRNIYQSNVTNITILPPEQPKLNVQGKLFNVKVVKRSKKLWKKKSDSRNFKPAITKNVKKGLPNYSSSKLPTSRLNSSSGNISELKNHSGSFVGNNLEKTTELRPDYGSDLSSLSNEYSNLDIESKAKGALDKSKIDSRIEYGNYFEEFSKKLKMPKLSKNIYVDNEGKKNSSELSGITPRKHCMDRKANINDPSRLIRQQGDGHFSMNQYTGKVVSKSGIKDLTGRMVDVNKPFEEADKVYENTKRPLDSLNISFEYLNGHFEGRNRSVEGTNKRFEGSKLFEGRIKLFKGKIKHFEGRIKLFERRINRFDGRNMSFGGINSSFDGRNSYFDERNSYFDERNSYFEEKNSSFEEKTPPFEGRKGLSGGRKRLSEGRNRNFKGRNGSFENLNCRRSANSHFGSVNCNFRGVNSRFEGVNSRFEDVNSRFDDVNSQLEGVNSRFEVLNSRHEGVNNRHEGVNNRHEGVNNQFEGVNRGFERVSRGSEGVNRCLEGVNRCLGGVNRGFGGVNRGFEGVNRGFEGVNRGFEGLNRGFEGLNIGFEGLNVGFEGLNVGFEGLNEGFESLNAGFESLNRGFEGVNRASESVDRDFEGINGNFERGNSRFEGVNRGFEGVNRGFKGVNVGFEGFNVGFEGLNQDLDGVNRDFEGVSRGYEGVNSHFEGINSHFEGVNSDFEGVNSRFEGGISRFEGGISRFEGGISRFEGGSSRFEGGSSRFKGVNRPYDEINKYLIKENHYGIPSTNYGYHDNLTSESTDKKCSRGDQLSCIADLLRTYQEEDVHSMWATTDLDGLPSSESKTFSSILSEILTLHIMHNDANRDSAAIRLLKEKISKDLHKYITSSFDD